MDQDQDQAWQAIDTQRVSVAGLLEGLGDEEWRHLSLCGDWTVRDVAAHLTLQQVGLFDAVAMMVSSPGGMNRTIRESARKRAATWSTTQIVAGIRDTAGSRKHNVGVTYQETLIDILVHGQDIALPLDRNLATPADVAALAATRVWTTGWPFHARRRLRGLRLAANDTTWSVGAGAEIRGSMGALLLLLTGRNVVLPMLTGDGVPLLQQRLSVPTR